MGRASGQEMQTITYFAPCDPRQGMGGGARVDQMLAALERIGYGINVVSYNGSGRLGLTRTALSNRTSMVQLAVPPQVPKMLKWMAVPMLILLGLICTKRKSVVIAHSPGIASGFIGLVVSMLKHGSLVVDFTDLRDNDTPEWAHKWVITSARIVFAVSRRLQTEARHLGASTVVHLPTFLDMGRYTDRVLEKAEVRRSLGLDREDRVVGYFGSFSRGEGLPILLEAFAEVAGAMPNAKLLVVGARNVVGADDVNRIVQELHLRERVVLLPAQPYSKIPMLMGATDLLVAPKIAGRENEVCDPTKIYEYLACGIPCVMSAISEIAITAQSVDAALVVEPGNSQALGHAIQRILSDRETADGLAARGRRLIESSYSIETGSRVVRQALASLGITVPIPAEK